MTVIDERVDPLALERQVCFALAITNRIEAEVRVWSRGAIELTVEGEGRDELPADRENRFIRGLEATLRAAREAVILLKNEGHLLPLDQSKYRRIAVIGPNAADVHLGGYSDAPGRGVSLLQRPQAGRQSVVP